MPDAASRLWSSSAIAVEGARSITTRSGFAGIVVPADGARDHAVDRNGERARDGLHGRRARFVPDAAKPASRLLHRLGGDSFGLRAGTEEEWGREADAEARRGRGPRMSADDLAPGVHDGVVQIARGRLDARAGNAALRLGRVMSRGGHRWILLVCRARGP